MNNTNLLISNATAANTIIQLQEISLVCLKTDKGRGALFAILALLTISGHGLINAIILNSNLRKKIRYVILMNLSVADCFTAISSITTTLVAHILDINEGRACNKIKEIIHNVFVFFFISSLFFSVILSANQFIAVKCGQLYRNYVTAYRVAVAIFTAWASGMIACFLFINALKIEIEHNHKNSWHYSFTNP